MGYIETETWLFSEFVYNIMLFTLEISHVLIYEVSDQCQNQRVQFPWNLKCYLYSGLMFKCFVVNTFKLWTNVGQAQGVQSKKCETNLALKGVYLTPIQAYSIKIEKSLDDQESLGK